MNYLDTLASSIIKIDHGEQRETEGHLTFTHIPTATQITVNKWSKFYYFLVRSSELLLNNSNGYLITGCPHNEIIDRQAIIARLKERFAQSQRRIMVVTNRQRRQTSMYESELPEQCKKICSMKENDFVEECLFDCLAFAVTNPKEALRIHEMHVSTSQQRQHLADNDVHTVQKFQECYQKGLVCKTMPNTDDFTNRGLTKSVSVLTIVFVFMFSFI